jgi:Fe-S-cluster containining protein
LPDERDLPAGRLSDWLDEFARALRDERDSVVPCGGCTACCRGSHFIHVGPEETDALAHIPRELLFPAPHRPPGHLLMGYDERGHCPMLVDDRCTIYEHRPRACRTYDCRIFAATGVDPADDGPAKVEVAARVARWRFDTSDPTDQRLQDDLRQAAADGAAATTASERAVGAVEVVLWRRGRDRAR